MGTHNRKGATVLYPIANPWRNFATESAVISAALLAAIPNNLLRAFLFRVKHYSTTRAVKLGHIKRMPSLWTWKPQSGTKAKSGGRASANSGSPTYRSGGQRRKELGAVAPTSEIKVARIVKPSQCC